MIDCRFAPIKSWPSEPTPAWKRQRGQFKAGWQSTLDLLEKELAYLRAKEITIEGYFAPADIRNDGWPKSSARPTQPGVILSFETTQGRMIFPCDTYTAWEANLRAVALTLEHLRAIERYGAVRDQQQYTGWLKLPAASPADEAYQLALGLAQMAGASDGTAASLLTNQALFDQVWRDAVRRTHPDNGGQADEFRTVMNARDRLRALKGWQ